MFFRSGGYIMANRYSEVLIGPHHVAIDITNKCNLRCLHCYNSSGENDVIKTELSDHEVLEFMKSLSTINLYSLCLCGGEPLLRKELIFDSLKILTENAIRTSMVTNGLLATEDTLARLDELGLNSIQFSLDGNKASHDKLRNQAGAYKQVLKAIEYVLKNTGMHLSIAFSPTRFNINDITEVYDLLKRLFIESGRDEENDFIDLRCQPLMILGRAKKHQDIIPSEFQYRKLVNTVRRLEVEGDAKIIQITWGDPVDHLIRYKNANNLLDQVVVHANGDIVVSAYLPLVIGNIRKHSLKEYWDKGLNKVWSTKIVQFLVSKMVSISEMDEITNVISDINMDSVLYIDLIDNDLNDMTVIKDIVDKIKHYSK